MSSFTIEIPVELREEIARCAVVEPANESAWIAEAAREKLAACAELQYLEQRGSRGSQEAYERVLAKVREVAPMPDDER